MRFFLKAVRENNILSFTLHNSKKCYSIIKDRSFSDESVIGDAVSDGHTETDADSANSSIRNILINDGAFYTFTTNIKVKTEEQFNKKFADSFGRIINRSAGIVLSFSAASKKYFPERRRFNCALKLYTG